VASEFSTLTVYDVQSQPPWVTEHCDERDIREKDGACHHVKWHTNSTMDSAAVNVEEVRSDYFHIAMFYVTVWFGGVATSTYVRDPISLAFFLNSTITGLKPFMKEYELNDF
jgi:hypothetical protein